MRLKFDLVYFEAAVQYFDHYAMGTYPSNSINDKLLDRRDDKLILEEVHMIPPRGINS